MHTKYIKYGAKAFNKLRLKDQYYNAALSHKNVDNQHYQNVLTPTLQNSSSMQNFYNNVVCNF